MMSHYAAILINQSDIEIKIYRNKNLSRKNISELSGYFHHFEWRVSILTLVVGAAFGLFQRSISQVRVDNIRFISIFLFSQGESEGYTVKTKEENFTISNYPLEQTEFLYGQKQGTVSSTQNNLSSILRYDYLPTGVNLTKKVEIGLAMSKIKYLTIQCSATGLILIQSRLLVKS